MTKLNSSGLHINGSLQRYVGDFALAKELQNPLWKSKSELSPDLWSHDVFAHEVNRENKIK